MSTPPPSQPEFQPPYPPPYSGGYPPYPMAPRNADDAVAGFVLAIVAWAVCPVIPAVLALVLADRADRRIRASGGWVTGSGWVTATRVIAWIHLGVVAAGLLFILGSFAFGSGIGDPEPGGSF